MGPHKYNRTELDEGRIGEEHVTELTRHWQRTHPPLAVDGYCGPHTRNSIEHALPMQRRIWPLLRLPDGRKPQVTSGFKTRNPSRPDHDGVDLFFAWRKTDHAMPPGSAVVVNNQRKWWVPDGVHAVAAADGVVGLSGEISTGCRCWIEHVDGLRTGYFHLQELLVQPQQRVAVGTKLGLVGGHPRHLHFEVSPTMSYSPMDPENWLEHAFVEA